MMQKLFSTLLAFLLVGTSLVAQDIEVKKEQYSLLTKKTATWCPICGGSAWDAFRKMIDDTQGKAICIAAHYDEDSELYSRDAREIVGNFEGRFGYGQPVFFYNSERLSGRDNNTALAAVEKVEAAFISDPIAQVGVYASVDPTTGVVTVNTKTVFYQSTTGKYKLAVYPMIKSITENQASRGTDTHKNILGNEFTDHSFGTVIAEGDIAADATYDYSFEFSGFVPELRAETLELVAIIWQETEENHEFINAFPTDDFVEETISSLTPVSIQDLDVTIQQEGNSTLIQLDNQLNQKEVSVNIFSTDGKLLHSLFKGNLAVGTHAFSTSLVSGSYVLSIRQGERTLAKQFVQY